MDSLQERAIQEPKTNYALWLVLGIGGLTMVGIVAYFSLKRIIIKNSHEKIFW